MPSSVWRRVGRDGSIYQSVFSCTSFGSLKIWTSWNANVLPGWMSRPSPGCRRRGGGAPPDRRHLSLPPFPCADDRVGTRDRHDAWRSGARPGWQFKWLLARESASVLDRVSNYSSALKIMAWELALVLARVFKCLLNCLPEPRVHHWGRLLYSSEYVTTYEGAHSRAHPKNLEISFLAPATQKSKFDADNSNMTGF